MKMEVMLTYTSWISGIVYATGQHGSSDFISTKLADSLISPLKPFNSRFTSHCHDFLYLCLHLHLFILFRNIVLTILKTNTNRMARHRMCSYSGRHNTNENVTLLLLENRYHLFNLLQSPIFICMCQTFVCKLVLVCVLHSVA